MFSFCFFTWFSFSFASPDCCFLPFIRLQIATALHVRFSLFWSLSPPPSFPSIWLLCGRLLSFLSSLSQFHISWCKRLNTRIYRIVKFNSDHSIESTWIDMLERLMITSMSLRTVLNVIKWNFSQKENKKKIKRNGVDKFELFYGRVYLHCIFLVIFVRIWYLNYNNLILWNA